VRIRVDSCRWALPGFRVFEPVVHNGWWWSVSRRRAGRTDRRRADGGKQAISRLNAEASSVGSQLPTISENDGPARNTKTFRGSDQAIAAGPPARVQRRIADTVSTQAGSMRPGRPK
jgi:hypothetical protein